MNYHDAVALPGEIEPAIRRCWLPEVNDRCQTFVGMLTSASKAPALDGVESFVTSLPAPRGPVEEVVLKGILLDLMLRISGADALRSSRSRGMPTHLTMPRSAAGLRIQPGWSDECATVWTAALGEVAREFAISSAGLRATQMMRARYAERWPLSRLARETGTNPQELAVSVREQFGITPRQYLERVRLGQAIIRVRRGDKIEFIPGEVGYGSRKNMNAAFTRVVGLRPSQIRSLSEEDVEMVRQLIARRLHPMRSTLDQPIHRTHREHSTREHGARVSGEHLDSDRFDVR